MLPSLGIRNYRNLKSLDIERLEQVNLISGKNNTGKTSLLEAVSLYATGGSIENIQQILIDRGETENETEAEKSYVRTFDCKSLFFERNNELEIQIGHFDSDKTKLSVRLTVLIESKEKSINPDTGEYTEVKRTIIPGKEKTVISGETLDASVGVGLVITHNGEDEILTSTEEKIKFSLGELGGLFSSKLEFIKTYFMSHDRNSLLWDRIALTDKENYVTDALRIIEPTADKFTFIGSRTVHRKPIIKLSDLKQPVPLQSLGEGMNRILTIILALVNASDGYLLIDEFENGLHYTVQEDLWKMIFKLAKELNVQVFATTHSDDCIHAFASVLNSEENQSEGQYFRLERFGDIIKPIFYSHSALEAAADQHIETR